MSAHTKRRQRWANLKSRFLITLAVDDEALFRLLQPRRCRRPGRTFTRNMTRSSTVAEGAEGRPRGPAAGGPLVAT